MVQFATRHAAAAVWKAVLEQTQVVLVLHVHRTSQGSGHVEREEYALICAGIIRRRVRQAACDAAVHRLGRCADCDHKESSENTKGVDNHRVVVKRNKEGFWGTPNFFPVFIYVASVGRLTSSRVQDQIDLAKKKNTLKNLDVAQFGNPEYDFMNATLVLCHLEYIQYSHLNLAQEERGNTTVDDLLT